MTKPRLTSPRSLLSPIDAATSSSTLRAKMRPVVRTSISDEIVDQIMALIASGDLKPGQRLPPERELCKTFQTGRPSLREAIRALCIVGVLNARVGDGTSVSVDGNKFLGKIVEWRLITEQHDLENLMEVRIALEGLAIANAARSADPTLIATLQKLMLRMKTAVDAMNQRLFVELDLEFHVTLASAARNDLLFDLVSMIRGQLANGLTRVAAHPRALPLSLKEHGQIVQAVKKHDPRAATAAMHNHLELSRKRYQDALKSSLASPSRPVHPTPAPRKLRAVTRS
jgi:GntR family transcriptional repressor for pyruvate dehydrogenase complex